MKQGRLSLYNDALASQICELIAEGKSFRAIAEMPGMPKSRTMFTWLREKEDFQQNYTRAKEEALEAAIEEIDYIANTEEDVNRARLKIDAIKWKASKLLANKYGEQKKVVDVNINSYQKWIQEEILVGEQHQELLQANQEYQEYE
jgi:hypothetical protein